MADGNGINGGDSIQNLLNELKLKAPELYSGIESYIESADVARRNAESQAAAANANLAQLQSLCDLGNMCAITLAQTPESGNQLLQWSIVTASTATNHLFGTANCTGRKLADFVKVPNEILLPVIIDENYSDTFELTTTDNKKHLTVNIIGMADGSLACSITDNTEVFATRSLLNIQSQYSELITESLSIVYSNTAYSEIFAKVLEQIGIHINPKRVLIFIDNEDFTIGQLNCTWTSNSFAPMPDDTKIIYENCPSWRKLLDDKKIITAKNLNDVPTDIAGALTDMGLNNALIFPLTHFSTKICGSLLVESTEEDPIDNAATNTLKVIATILSGLITHKLVTDDLIHEKKRAQEADRLKSSFLVNMSHDIRIPMNSIIGFSDLLADEDLTQTEREEFIDMINKSGKDLISLIDNIIDISKIETGQMTVKKEACPLLPLLNDIIAVFRNDSKLEEHDDLTLQLDFAPQYADYKFSTDIFKFRQICTNLIENAIKFTNSGTIKFGISKAWDETIEFYVQDTGIGISEDQQQLIFKRFIKVDRTFANEYTGTGLGLSICKSLVEMLGGEINVVSVPGKGSTFYFTHPLDCHVPESVANPREVKSIFDWKERKIAIINDIEQDRKYLTHVLLNTGIEIIWLTAEESVNYFKSGNSADILLIEMSTANIEAATKIHNISPIPIVAQSSNYKSDDDRTFAIKSGCSEYIVKPINVTKFLSIIDGLFAPKA